MHIGRCWFFSWLVFWLPLSGFDYDPWFRNLYEIEAGTSISFERYRSIDSEGKPFSYETNNQWLRFYSGAVVTPCLRIQSEIEIVRTNELDPGMASVGVLAQYLLFHDVIGDPVTTTLGLLVYGSPADLDPSILYHGRVGAELSLTVGKELCYRPIPQVRIWAIGKGGIADHGDPWFAGQGQLDAMFIDGQKLEFWVVGIMGRGNQPFPVVEEFLGYGSLHYRAVDIGIGYGYEIPYLFNLFLRAEHRIYTRNYPEGTWMFTLELLYPFSL